MNDYGKLIEPATVQLERMLPGPIERVWAFLTESEKRSKWFAPGDMDLKVGSKFTLHFDHSKLTPHPEDAAEDSSCAGSANKGTLGTILQCEPPKLLSYTFDEDGAASSEVTFELSEKGENVLLILTHRRLPNRDIMLSVAGGWHTHIGILMAVLDGTIPAPFWSTHEALVKEYAKRLK